MVTTKQHFWHILSGKLESVELLTGYEGDAFTSTGRIEEDLLAMRNADGVIRRDEFEFDA